MTGNSFYKTISMDNNNNNNNKCFCYFFHIFFFFFLINFVVFRFLLRNCFRLDRVFEGLQDGGVCYVCCV
jgi:hypothetical protein